LGSHRPIPAKRDDANAQFAFHILSFTFFKMTRFNRANNLTGWIVFAIALITYTLTVERTASFWDCGEFIACAFKLQVPHPPGAPFFLLIGRLFSLFAFGDLTNVAYWVNMVSVLSSAFTILFLFWTITLMNYQRAM
jgi:heme/copper-type cytochrome/quinol oxidase subunit 4